MPDLGARQAGVGITQCGADRFDFFLFEDLVFHEKYVPGTTAIIVSATGVYWPAFGKRECGDTMSRYAKQIDDIRTGKFTRAQLAIMETNAKRTITQGDPEAALVLEAIRQAKPRDLYYVFMGFCPNADLSNRVDGEWREQGICSMDLWESAGSERQAAEFMSIKVGDLVILKKNQKIGETMRLSGFGRVTRIRASTDPLQSTTC